MPISSNPVVSRKHEMSFLFRGFANQFSEPKMLQAKKKGLMITFVALRTQT